MKIKVQIRNVVIFSGIVSIPEEKYKEYKLLKNMDIVNKMLMRGLSKNDSWSLECFKPLEDKNDDRGQ